MASASDPSDRGDKARQGLRPRLTPCTPQQAAHTGGQSADAEAATALSTDSGSAEHAFTTTTTLKGITTRRNRSTCWASIQKNLVFTDGGLEAAFRGHAAEKGRGPELSLISLQVGSPAGQVGTARGCCCGWAPMPAEWSWYMLVTLCHACCRYHRCCLP